jgi:hypothetical protein
MISVNDGVCPLQINFPIFLFALTAIALYSPSSFCSFSFGAADRWCAVPS